VFVDEEHERAFAYLPGQFAEVSVDGFGESPIGIASSPTEKGYLLFTIKQVGLVTTELHGSSVQRIVGVRGPLGRAFPWGRMRGKNILIVGGGFAFTTLRSAILYMLDPENRREFGKITVIYGARSPGELLYKDELARWQASSEIATYVTVDKGDDGWTGLEGFVPQVLGNVAPPAENAVALVCGPPVMIKYSIPVLTRLGFRPEDIILSLEMRMKCGIGKCGRCNIGNRYVCKDGPVFTLGELSALPDEY
jgi:NAD(P)H-flavin reductase